MTPTTGTPNFVSPVILYRHKILQFISFLFGITGIKKIKRSNGQEVKRSNDQKIKRPKDQALLNNFNLNFLKITKSFKLKKKQMKSFQ